MKNKKISGDMGYKNRFINHSMHNVTKDAKNFHHVHQYKHRKGDLWISKRVPNLDGSNNTNLSHTRTANSISQ